MANLIVPEAALEVGSPYLDGLTTVYGLSRDWRPDATWTMENAEYIEPLGAIAPATLAQPDDMSGWTLTGAPWNQRMRLIRPNFRGGPQSWQLMDGAVRAQATGSYGQVIADDWCESILPRFALFIVRNVPPTGQVVQTVVRVSVPTIYAATGGDVPGRLYFYLPLAGYGGTGTWENRGPFLHHLLDSDAGGWIDLSTDGEIISEYTGRSGMAQGPEREGWLFEYEEDADKYDGGHILIRPMLGLDKWWHYHDPKLRLASKDVFDAEGVVGYLADGRWEAMAAGAVTMLNVTPITYGSYDGVASPLEAKPLPDNVVDNALEAGSFADEGNSAFDTVRTDADDWLVSVALPTDLSQKPEVTFELGAGYAASSVYERPVLWYPTETQEGTVGDALAGRESTQGDSRLMSVDWTWGRGWKGSRGNATFSAEVDTELYPTWKENANVLLRMGWSTGAGAGLELKNLVQCYIPPGGLRRSRDGSDLGGDAQLAVELGGYDTTRLQQKDVRDIRQAGGQTVTEWAAGVADRLGIAVGRLSVDAAVAAQVIPLNAIPSKPSLAPRDGDSWRNHIAEVERAADIRVCWTRGTAYDMWVDEGLPEYEAGVSTIAYEIDYAETDPPEITYDIDHDRSIAAWRNFLKATTGREDERVEYYLSQTLADRKAGVGDDWPVSMEDDDAPLGELYQTFLAEHWNAGQSVITWTMPMRVDLLPDMFVRVVDCPDVEIEDNSVFQIIEHSLSLDMQAFDADSRLRAQIVWTPTGGGGGAAGGGGTGVGGMSVGSIGPNLGGVN